MSINSDLISKLDRNSKNVFIGSITICLKLLENIINNPREEKFRKFKKTNPKIANELLALDGMEELLLTIGFELLDNGEFALRRGGIGIISKLKSYRDVLLTQLELVKNSKEDEIKPKVIAKSTLGAIPRNIPIVTFDIRANRPFHERINFPSVINSSNPFLRQLEQLSDSVMQYEDEALQKSALQLIPIEKLKLNAIENLRKFQKLIKEKEINEDEPPLNDFFLEQLASWFKNEFFTWVNNMSCRNCGNEDTKPSSMKIQNGVRVEQYLCEKCNVITEFPRYNDIEKLLVTKKGRCGEFANMFTFLCRCFKYDARFIYCTSDHVWTEVYYHSKNRFIHIDPSENVFDSPYMYEKGWQKKIDYVLAFSHDDVQDVSWRYSNQHEELKKRRRNCTEAELMSTIVALRNKRQMGASNARKKFLTLRTLAELSEMMMTREPTKDELRGRSSGSLAWRLERGETSVSSNYVFELWPEEENAKQFNIRYSAAKNRYERFIGGNILKRADDWKIWEYQSQNVFRKVEHDHKMAYLSRTEDSEIGSVEWKFDFKSAVIKSIDLKFETKTFESGYIRLNFLDSNGKIVESKENLIGCNGFSIIANLSGGNGDCAWQHAQLFRESLNSNNYSFQLSVQFS